MKSLLMLRGWSVGSNGCGQASLINLRHLDVFVLPHLGSLNWGVQLFSFFLLVPSLAS